MEDAAQAAGYVAIADTLRVHLATLPPNSLLPTEQQLARRFAVSRGTVRRALALLEAGGLLSRPASAEMAAVLGLRPGRLIVANTFVYYLRRGAPLEAGVMAYRVDRCKFTFTARFDVPERRSRRRQ